MKLSSEQHANESIDQLLTAVSFCRNPGLFIQIYVDGKTVGVIEAKKGECDAL